LNAAVTAFETISNVPLSVNFDLTETEKEHDHIVKSLPFGISSTATTPFALLAMSETVILSKKSYIIKFS
jgi:hypothetical protein